ncbi:MAG: hypothetical protein ACRD0J_04625 [Acidimicrobiales bacterium]
MRIFSQPDLIDTLAASGWQTKEIETRNLAAAIAWIFHGLLRTPADHTGAVSRLAWLEPAAAKGLRGLRGLPGGARAVSVVESHFGKSWYVHAR